MKALVYIVCVAVAAMVQTAISMSGVQLGGLPVVLLYGTALAVATAACKAIQRRKVRPAIPKERWYTCPKCGQLVREGEKCDCEQVALAQEEQPEVAEKRGGWQRILPYIGCLLLAAFFVISLLAAIRSNREPEICARCSSDGELTASCPCCFTPICQSCFADIEYEHNEAEQSRYNSGFEEGYGEAEQSFSSWTDRAKAYKEAESDWEALHSKGYVSLSFDEWWVFVKGTYLAGNE